MFDKFGKFESYEEINKAAEGLKDEGDRDSLIALAEENGLSEMVDYYIAGDTPMLCGEFEAAEGRIKVEKEALKAKGLMNDWCDYIIALAADNPEISKSIMKNDLAGCLGALLKEAFEHQIDVNKEIIENAGIKAGKVTFGVPDMARAREIIKEYYEEG